MENPSSFILDNHIAILFLGIMMFIFYSFYENFFKKKETDDDWFEQLVTFHIVAKNKKRWDIVGKKIPISTDKSYIIKNNDGGHTRIFKR